MSKGVNRLAQAIDAWTAKKMAVPPSIDLGTIGEDGSLKLDQFGPALPRSAYLIAEWMVDATSDGDQLPNLELQLSLVLKPGDRVLVLWVRDDPVVISKVVPADA
jgi:hypothetical protein